MLTVTRYMKYNVHSIFVINLTNDNYMSINVRVFNTKDITKQIVTKHLIYLFYFKAVSAIREYRPHGVMDDSNTFSEPWEHQAQVLAEVYRYRSGLRAQGRIPSADQIHRIRLA